MNKLNPPFRADQVGSLLRPKDLLEKRFLWKSGQLPSEELREAEDEAITDIVKKVESIGMLAVTDGEFRRDYFHLDFLQQLEGVSVTGAIAINPHAKAAEDGFTPPKLSVTGKLRHVRAIQVDDFNFLKSVVTKMPKVSIPSPTMVHFRGGRKAIDIDAYPEMEEFFSDLSQCYRDEIAALHRAGCRYIQLDDTNLAYLCDARMREEVRQRGDDPDELPRTYAALINSVLRDRPDDLTIAVHLCRGNYRSTWFAEGGYEPVAEILFNDLDVDAYFLEYDDERSGDFAPLRFVPKNKAVVLGLISSKVPGLENKKDLVRRIEEAAQYMDIENMCISPQCGFSSTSHGNKITMDDQWRKLELVVQMANEVWRE